MSLGACSICGEDVQQGASFINTGPTDSNDPTKPKSLRWVPVDEDIHGWSPFVISHPACFAREAGAEALMKLVDESHRLMRRSLLDR